MIVIFEFMGNEPIENVITSMNFRVDKTVFFGYHDVIQEQKDIVKNFLCEDCKVQQVVFYELPSNDLQSILKTMREAIEYELAQGNDIYFDITGGESLILVAFGILSNEYETPMHSYNVEENELIELDEGAEKSISIDVPCQSEIVKLDLDQLIKLRGGIINEKKNKNIHKINDDDFAADADQIWKVAKKHNVFWNPFSNFLRENMIPDENLYVTQKANLVLKALNESNSKLKTPRKLNEILDDLENAGVICDLVHTDGRYSFSYKNRNILDCLQVGGSILELHIYGREKQKDQYTDCRVGVHLDWDGVIEDQPGKDVLNEIDVLTIQGNIPTFISCKSGKIDGEQALHALYELETVAQRFGGKYAKKILVVCNELRPVYLARAEEMGIEIERV